MRRNFFSNQKVAGHLTLLPRKVCPVIAALPFLDIDT